MFQRRIAFVAVLVCLAPTSSKVVVASDFSEEELAAFAIVEDATNAFVARAYDPFAKQEIYQRALDGLILRLGTRFQKHKRDLISLPEFDALAEYCDQLRQIASTAGQPLTIRELVEESIKGVCKSIDPYCSYVTGGELTVFQRTRQSPKSGIGITVYENDDGTMLGFPIKGSAAEAAGIVPGEELIAVDGNPVSGKTQEMVANWIRGIPGTEVQLQMKRNFGQTERIKILREALNIRPFEIEERFGDYTIYIRKFTPDLPEMLEGAIKEIKPRFSLTIDLRGNPGGDIVTATRTADLFIDADQPVGSVRERTDPEVFFRTEKKKVTEVPRLVLLQNGGTASAAEIFIAALVQNPQIRAVSQGNPTFGKGRVQQLIRLNAGGQLKLTVGEYFTPNGESVDKIGLLPSVKNSGKLFEGSKLPEKVPNPPVDSPSSTTADCSPP